MYLSALRGVRQCGSADPAFPRDKLIVIIPVAFVLLVVGLGVVGFYYIRKSAAKYRTEVHTQQSHVAVVHGQVVAPGELQASGKLYFVPMGKQVIPVRSLAEYYQKKFAMHISILPEVALDAADCLPPSA